MKGYRTKKIALPGGRTIEIVYFHDEADETGATGAGHGHAAPDDTPPPAGPAETLDATGLHHCPECDSDLVYPIAWEERGPDGWHIQRRCPNCEWRDEGDFHQDDVEQFDDVLNEGTESLLTGLRNFSRANMESDVERLIDAINADRILPMDF
ncbi:MAG: hypothetical protein AB1416_06575 [Actinomycetota bacterium]